MAKHNTVKLEANAHELIEQDKANVVLTIETIKPTRSEVQLELKNKAEDTFKILKKFTLVESSTHGQNIHDNQVMYGNQVKKEGVKGSFSIALVSTDFQKINEAIDAVQGIAQVSQITTNISTAKKNRAEAQLTEDVIKEFKAKALAITKSFDFTSYQILKVNISGAQNEQEYGSYALSNMREGSAPEVNSLYVQPRHERITVSLDGEIVMQKKEFLG